MSFEFFDYGEQRRFVFLQVPKLLLSEERYRNLSGDAKILYSLMLERGELSHQNGWYDERGRPFIYFTIEDVMEKLRIGHSKASVVLKDLEKADLIARVRQGQGKPNRIYVGRFYEDEMFPGIQTSEKQMSEVAEIKRSGKRKSGKLKTGDPDSRISDTNKKELIKTERNKTESIDPMDAIEEMRAYFDYNCSFEELKKVYPYHTGELEAIRELLVDVCTTTKPTVRIMGEDKPTEVVRSRLEKLNSSHIGYVMDRMNDTTTKITNIRQYLLAALYNAPVTIDHYYTTLVHHDMVYGPA